MTKERWIWPNSVITRIIDGDTLTARLTRDLGFHGTATFDQRLRLNRINAPAIKSPAGKETAKFVSDLLLPVPVMIETVGAYKYGDEWMAEITAYFGSSINISDLLVLKGLAVYWDGTGPRPAEAG